MNQDKATEKLAGVKYAGAVHTPGPWEVQSNMEIIVDATGLKVCDIEPDYRTIEQSDANARLIAAAPDLLEACNEALEWLRIAALPGLETTRNRIQSTLDAAIRKATERE